jgi:DNA processing protein
MQITNIIYASSQYPENLREIHNPPQQLHLLGKLKTDIPLVAIVGSRRPTAYGRKVTYELAYNLARAGVGIVSGLALGVDAMAHRGAIDAGGYTIAVLGNGLSQIHPPSNRPLGLKILANSGAIISELDLNMPPLKQHFPARNRIIAGLSLGTVVTESAASSGSLITADFANKENRIVMAVPGNITSLMSAGPNNLLRTGAVPVVSASDVLAAIGYEGKTSFVPEPPKSADEAKIINLLEDGHSTGEDLITHSGMSAAKFAEVISLMEITGKVRNLGAGNWIRRK